MSTTEEENTIDESMPIPYIEIDVYTSGTNENSFIRNVELTIGDINTMPPGLHRRNAYGEYVRQRRLAGSSNDNRSLFSPESTGTSVSQASEDTSVSSGFIVDRPRSYDMPTNVTITEYTEENRYKGPGLISKGLLDNSKIVLNDDNFDQCSICLEKDLGSPLRVLSCSHYFHINCIDNWFTSNSKCPMCRKSFKSENFYNPLSLPRTGSLVITRGIGIEGDLYHPSVSTVTGSLTAIGGIGVRRDIYHPSVSTVTGSLTAVGGLDMAEDVYNTTPTDSTEPPSNDLSLFENRENYQPVHPYFSAIINTNSQGDPIEIPIIIMHADVVIDGNLNVRGILTLSSESILTTNCVNTIPPNPGIQRNFSGESRRDMIGYSRETIVVGDLNISGNLHITGCLTLGSYVPTIPDPFILPENLGIEYVIRNNYTYGTVSFSLQ